VWGRLTLVMDWWVWGELALLGVLSKALSGVAISFPDWIRDISASMLMP